MLDVTDKFSDWNGEYSIVDGQIDVRGRSRHCVHCALNLISSSIYRALIVSSSQYYHLAGNVPRTFTKYLIVRFKMAQIIIKAEMK